MHTRSGRVQVLVLLAAILVLAIVSTSAVSAGGGKVRVEVFAEPGERVYLGPSSCEGSWYQAQANDFGQVTMWIPEADIQHCFWSESGIEVVRDLSVDSSHVCLREGGCVFEDQFSLEQRRSKDSDSPLPTPTPPDPPIYTCSECRYSEEWEDWYCQAWTQDTPCEQECQSDADCIAPTYTCSYCDGDVCRAYTSDTPCDQECQSDADCITSGSDGCPGSFAVE